MPILHPESAPYEQWLAELNQWSKEAYGKPITAHYPDEQFQRCYMQGWNTHKVKINLRNCVQKELPELQQPDRNAYMKEKMRRRRSLVRNIDIPPQEKKQTQLIDALYRLSQGPYRTRLDQLSQQDQTIIELKLFTQPPQTFAQIGQELGISRQWACRKFIRSLKHLGVEHHYKI